jgi:RNA polymerase sigma factor (sigma-70 family)
MSGSVLRCEKNRFSSVILSKNTKTQDGKIFVTKSTVFRLTAEDKEVITGIMDYEKLYNTYYMQVYSYVMTLIKDSDLAEELTQQVFFKAISTKADFGGRSGELTWLCSIAKNACCDELRRRRHFSGLPPGDERPSADQVEKTVMDADTTYRIHVILHHLEEPYKEVFSLRVFGELPFAKIASIFGKTESWARVTYHRARLKIKERMDHDHE